MKTLNVYLKIVALLLVLFNPAHWHSDLPPAGAIMMPSQLIALVCRVST